MLIRRSPMSEGMNDGLRIVHAQSTEDLPDRVVLTASTPPSARAVALVIPPSPFLLDERVFVSLGLLKVAGALEHAGHPVSVLDLSGIENYEEALEEYLRKSQDFALGVTTTTPQLPSVMRIAKLTRARRPDLRLILGGPHVTLVHAALRGERKRGLHDEGRAKAAMRTLDEAFDVLVAGDGELAVLAALADDPPRLVDGDDRNGPFFLSDADFTDSPPPARHLVDMESYRYSIEGHPATSLIAQLGCPFACGFCGGRASNALRVIRTRSVTSVVHEVERLHRAYGYTGFMFYDDELNVSKTMIPMMDELTQLQERLGVEFRLRGFVKSELLTAAQAEAMVRAGFRWILTGFEAADPRILLNINKRATLEDNTRAVEIAKNAGLKVKALMSCGHPGESEATVRAIEEWLVKVEVDDFDCTIITTYPGTPYYDLAVPHASLDGVYTYSVPRTGDRLHSFDVDYSTTADYYKGDPADGYRAFVFTDHLQSKDLVALRNHVESSVRARLNIPFNPARAAMRYEHSMGQGLPDFILRHQSPGTMRETA
ncbi:MAG: radical SAM protein [Myxococcota bacterium]